MVSIYHTNSSGVLSSLAWADGLVELPEDCTGVAPGDAVEYLPFSGGSGVASPGRFKLNHAEPLKVNAVVDIVQRQVSLRVSCGSVFCARSRG